MQKMKKNNKKCDFLILGAQEPIQSRLTDNSNVFRGIPPYFMPYGRDFIRISQKAYSFPAYAIPILAGILRKLHFSVSCINDFYSDNPAAAREKIKKTRYAVFISTTFLTKKRSITDVAKFVRDANPAVKIVMGGAGIVNFPGARRFADINIFYEGEDTVAELAPLLSGRRAISRVKGISYFNGTKEISMPRRDCIKDLGRLTLPDWRTLSRKVREEKYLPIESSRGCIGNCSFCLETKYWPGVRFYPVDRVIREIKENIKRFGIRFYYFQDSNISNSRAYLTRLIEAIRDEQLKITWSCESRIDTVTEELVAKMRNSGCRAITFGMESADERVLRNMNKPMTDKKMKSFSSIVRSMRREGMLANINVIVGFPGEDKKSIEKTIQFLLETEPITYSMSKFFLEKGTGIWKARKKFSLKGSMYKWTHTTMKSGELDGLLRHMFLSVSRGSRIYHWPSASVDLIRHMGKGKSFSGFVKYLKSVNHICAEDLDRKKNEYSRRYNDSMRDITDYLTRWPRNAMKRSM
ncbi:MAG: B12-binding domain-containing radical SAM protein [Omnitrophica bacterium]|nr:B12-binding domain-containing radical SAM protein [Candidatus Omnitrophota bacterium]